jgi:hypothetical protein
MPLQILQPTLFTTPNGGGHISVNSPSTTGHATTEVLADGFVVFEETASCRWHTFQNPSGQVLSITLKLTWAADGDMQINANNGFFLQYSINGGSNWIDIVNQGVVGPVGASPSIAIPANTPISQIQVRDSFTAISGTFEGFPSSASLQASVSGIQLEVTTANPQMIILM